MGAQLGIIPTLHRSTRSVSTAWYLTQRTHQITARSRVSAGFAITNPLTRFEATPLFSLLHWLRLLNTAAGVAFSDVSARRAYLLTHPRNISTFRRVAAREFGWYYELVFASKRRGL